MYFSTVKEFLSIIVRKSKRSPKLTPETSDYPKCFENTLHNYPDMLAKLDSSISYLHEFSNQCVQDFFKELLGEQFKLFKETKADLYIPTWALSKEKWKYHWNAIREIHS